MTRLQADVEQEQQAAAEMVRTVEGREHALSEAEADMRVRTEALERREQEAEAAEQSRADEAERVRRAAARRSKPPEVPEGFLAGLEALASASHERRTRRDRH